MMGEFTPNPPYDLPFKEDEYAPLRLLREELLGRFPISVDYADKTFSERWDDTDLNCFWLTAFAESTANGMRKRDAELVSGHLQAISEKFDRASQFLKNLIDVNYMEDLFYDVDVESSRWGWQHVPKNLKKLYTDYWGQVVPRFVSRLEDPKQND